MKDTPMYQPIDRPFRLRALPKLSFKQGIVLLVALCCGGVMTGRTAQAQALYVEGNGSAAVTTLPRKDAEVKIDGIDPRSITLQSIIGDKAPRFPNDPPTSMDAEIIGMAYVGFGVMGGRLEAEAKASSPSYSDYGAGATGLMEVGFLDDVFVSSSTLAVGTPVNIDFHFSLDSGVLATGSLGSRSFAEVAAEFAVLDGRTGSRIEPIFTNFTTYMGPPKPTSYKGTLHTAVGNGVRFTGRMKLYATTSVVLPGEGGGAVQSNASVIADHTAHLYYQPTPDVNLVSLSGHDYDIAAAVVTVPEPGTFALAAFGLLPALAVVCRRARSIRR